MRGISEREESSIKKVLKILSKNVYELSEKELKELLTALPSALNEVPDLTKSGIEKVQLYKTLKEMIEELENNGKRR